MVIDTLYINKFNIVKTILVINVSMIVNKIAIPFKTINIMLIMDFSLIIKL